MAAVANTSAGPRNVQRKNNKSGDSLANRRHPIIRTPSSADDKETNDGETRADCIQDYSPCYCAFNSNQIRVSCLSVSVETVRDVFQRVNDTEIYEVELGLLADDTNTVSIPLDFLGNTSVRFLIDIHNSNYSNLVIDPLAFRSSQNSLYGFFVNYFDFGLQKDFKFLNGFDKLRDLHIYDIINFTAFQYLPPLPSLWYLVVNNVPEINQIPFPDLSSTKLKELELPSNGISDEKADEILAKLVAWNSADSLQKLDLERNSLTRIPSQVMGSAFSKLKYLDLAYNKISHLPSSSLTFASPSVEYLYLHENDIKTIESGAFRGISTAVVHASLFFLLIKKKNTVWYDLFL